MASDQSETTAMHQTPSPLVGARPPAPDVRSSDRVARMLGWAYVLKRGPCVSVGHVPGQPG